MANPTITIATKTNYPKKFLVEIDTHRLEKLASALGLFNTAFLESLDRAEKDYQTGKYRKVKSLKELRSS